MLLAMAYDWSAAASLVLICYRPDCHLGFYRRHASGGMDSEADGKEGQLPEQTAMADSAVACLVRRCFLAPADTGLKKERTDRLLPREGKTVLSVFLA